MKKRLSIHEKAILENLDRMLAGQALHPASGYVEEKILQVLNSLAYKEEKKNKQQDRVSQLISDISHQIKTPLSALSLQLELAEDEAFSENERKMALESCRAQVDKIRFLTDGIFKIARLESELIELRPESGDIIPTILEAVSTVKGAAMQKGLDFHLELPDTLIVTHDPVWTKEVVVNLLDNAIKYTDHGSVSLKLEQAAIYTMLSVSDTGIGIKPVDYPRVFERFYRGQKTRGIQGTGLGLSIAREIMRKQGGNITVSSGEHGSVFTVFLQNC